LTLSRENKQDVLVQVEPSAPLQSDQSELLEDEIAWRHYVEVLGRRWKWIVSLAIAAIAVAGIASLLVPPTYEATATVVGLANSQTPGSPSPAVLSPQVQLTLISSPEIASKVIPQLNKPSSSTPVDPSALSRQVQVRTDPNDKSLFRVVAQANSPKLAADLANAWAGAAVALLNQQPQDALRQSIASLEQDKGKAQSDLQVAEENLKRLERDSQLALLTQEISRTQQALTLQVAQRESVRAYLTQAQTLKQQVQQGQVTLTAEMLLNLQTTASASDTSFIVQPSQLTTLTKAEQMDRLNALSAALLAKQTALDQSVERLMQQASDLQRQLNDKENLLIEPRRIRDSAQADYDAAVAQWRNATARLVEAQNAAWVVSRATPPDSPAQPKPLQNIAIEIGRASCRERVS
jgi:uncharacterized protein involved in exopolysaccharide biosynthesis